ncbi:hypothetical protein M4578_23255 [Salipiger sp. P9]|uniref:hypothetical protein n=1 Tax=Salipiger pentaromativorans TaxID=2943193 RepID=UPI0021581306|nr:hypothetical protein [Salipiger pentaromativorans]MCR8550753.1 hypothetical protein [Salipiger pentaromativorans]
MSRPSRRFTTLPGRPLATAALCALALAAAGPAAATDLKFSGCGPGMKREIATAYEFLLHRAKSQRARLIDCIDRAYLVEHSRKSPTKIVNDLTRPNVTKFKCTHLPGANANAHKVYRKAGVMNIDRDFIRDLKDQTENDYGVRRLASVIGHELMHNAGYKHTGNPVDTTLYQNTVPEQMEACLLNLHPNDYEGIGKPEFIASEMVGFGLDGETNEVFAWSEGKFVTAGSTTRMHNFRHPRNFTVAPGTAETAIVGMGLDGSTNMVFAWLRDGRVIAGSSEDLDSKRAPYRYRLPAGYTPGDIVGMAVDGENNYNFAWYRDGRVSAGTSDDLGKFRAPYRYSLAPGYTPQDVAGMALDGENNMVFVFYKDNMVSAGTTDDLDRFRAPARVITGR